MRNASRQQLIPPLTVERQSTELLKKSKVKDHIYFSKKDLINAKFLISRLSERLADDSMSGGAIKIWFSENSPGTSVLGGKLGEQRIKTKQFDNQIINVVMHSLAEISSWTNLKFKRVNNKNLATTRIYLDEGFRGATLRTFRGLATYTKGEDQIIWEVFINNRRNNSSNELVYTILHEIGHTLGLEHLDDVRDRDKIKNTQAIRPHHTLMSNKTPTSKNYPENFTVNDIHALQKLWGINSNKGVVRRFIREPITPYLMSDSIIGSPSPAKRDFIINGKATPKSTIRVRINDNLYQKPEVDLDGNWSLSITKGLQAKLKDQPGSILDITQITESGYLNKSESYSIDFL
jgi:hypothetical protein